MFFGNSLKLFGLLLLFGFCHACVAAPAVRVLIFTGQNNHNWRETTPKLKAILESNGRFSVEVTEHFEEYNAETLQKYDVLLSNWNTFGKAAVTNWSPALQKALLDFVRGGRGYVSVHAGSSAFYDWPEYHQLAGGTWKVGQTGHGPQHEFTVKLAGEDHPITRGLTNFPTTDELWHRAGLQAGVQILATAYSALEKRGTGKNEPIAFVSRFGNGRSFNLLLGHDAKAMDASGFQQLLRSGTEWAATGNLLADKK